MKLLLPWHLLALLLDCSYAMIQKQPDIVIAGYRPEYESKNAFHQQEPLHKNTVSEFSFGRFQSPESIQKAFDSVRSAERSFKPHCGKDGRKGYVSATKLGGDWVLAESKQTAVQCKAEDVIRAYLSGHLQTQWNADTVVDCQIALQQHCKPGDSRDGGGDSETTEYYQQDLVLRSMRIIRRHTGEMRYSQSIVFDKVREGNYCVSVQLEPNPSGATTTKRKPFDALQVYISLQEKEGDVHIYAAGVMKVNRAVVPNLVIFDASGIAGSMAGKGTLWLAGHFEKRRQAKDRVAN